MTASPAPSRPVPRLIVVGGGLAGVAAALRAADAGFSVTLVESRPRLGGVAGSLRRPSPAGADGTLTVDTGQHVALRGYGAYRALLDRIGMGDGLAVQSRLDLPVLRGGEPPARLRRVAWPAPAHLLPGLLRYRALPPAQRAHAVSTALALRALRPDDPQLDAVSFGAWLRARGEQDAAVAALWGLIALAALNAPVDQVSLASAVRVFRTGLLDHADAGDLAVPVRPLGELHDVAARRALVAAAVTVRTGHRVRSVRTAGSGSSAGSWRVCGDGIDLAAEAVVVAVPHRVAAPLLADTVPTAGAWAGLGSQPIVTVHVVYDRPVTAWALAAALDSPVQWIFDRTAAAGAAAGTQYLALVLSGADAHLPTPARDLRARFLPALAALLPAAHDAVVLDAFVTREPHATFRQAPGTLALRPPARPGPAGLGLAGAWVDTGFPDTMEGAVRSGWAAVDACADVRADVGSDAGNPSTRPADLGGPMTVDARTPAQAVS